ncbi:MAG: transposase [Thermoguttaceae bacterium]|nr:transposase [Thermoguttaceae bacterium]
MPKPRGNFVVEYLKVLKAILYVAENGCKWRALPRRYGHHWNTVYCRFRRRAENDVLSQASEALQKEELIDADFSVLSLDSTFVKSSPSAAGALKKRAASDRSNEGRAHDQDSCARRRPDDAGRVKTHAWERQRRARRSRTSPKP